MIPDNKPEQTRFDMNAQILKAMAHPVRLVIVNELLWKPWTGSGQKRTSKMLEVFKKALNQRLNKQGK